MALKKTESKTRIPSSEIGVNRGQGFAALKNVYQGSNVTDAINSFLNTKVEELKKDEKEKGTQLGKNATLIYENFIDENGNEIPIARSYQTPDAQLKTSWSHHNFHEEAAETLSTALPIINSIAAFSGGASVNVIADDVMLNVALF